jgi:hypothetical protein
MGGHVAPMPPIGGNIKTIKLGSDCKITGLRNEAITSTAASNE